MLHNGAMAGLFGLKAILALLGHLYCWPVWLKPLALLGCDSGASHVPTDPTSVVSASKTTVVPSVKTFVVSADKTSVVSQDIPRALRRRPQHGHVGNGGGMSWETSSDVFDKTDVSPADATDVLYVDIAHVLPADKSRRPRKTP